MKKYQLIYADPAWPFRVWNRDTGQGRSAEAHYRTMSMQAICDLPIADLADKNCVLFVWAVWPSLPDAFRVIDAWGFEFKTLAWEWVKLNKLWNKFVPKSLPVDNGDYNTWFPRLFAFGMGYYTRANPEPCLLAVKKRGNYPVAVHNERNLLFAPLREHSQKPEEAYDKINRLYPEAWPRLELFARNTRPGWDCWGNEVENSIKMPDKKPIQTMLVEGSVSPK